MEGGIAIDQSIKSQTKTRGTNFSPTLEFCLGLDQPMFKSSLARPFGGSNKTLHEI